MRKEYNVAIVLAAGRGSRMNSPVQKQYLTLGGKPVLYYSLKQFEDFEEIQEVILVTGEKEIAYCREKIVDVYGLRKVSQIIAGGKERYHSVYNGLRAARECDYVFIHDGARPFIDGKILSAAMQAVRTYHACVVGMPVKDTIKIADENRFAEQTPSRDKLWMVQTPQVFSYSLIREAYERLFEQKITDITDDAMVLERMQGYPVKLVEGSYQNIKLTTPEDLMIAETFLGVTIHGSSANRPQTIRAAQSAASYDAYV